MKHNRRFMVMAHGGRFATEAHKKFFRDIGTAWGASREYTTSELAVAQIEDSLENDIKSGSRTHEHGNDVQSISRAKMAVLRDNIQSEVIEAEAVCIQAEIDALQDLLRDRQTRLQEIQGSRTHMDDRALFIARAADRIANKSGRRYTVGQVVSREA